MVDFGFDCDNFGIDCVFGNLCVDYVFFFKMFKVVDFGIYWLFSMDLFFKFVEFLILDYCFVWIDVEIFEWYDVVFCCDVVIDNGMKFFISGL